MLTVIEALQTMHDNKFLNLPVCEDDVTVCGLVGVMDFIIGCGGADCWRSLFDSTMGMSGGDGSETASQFSAGTRSIRSSRTMKSSVHGSISKSTDGKPVSKLRPEKPLISNIKDNVLMVAQMLASKRGSASLVIGVNGGLAGIVTDTDVTRRLVARDLNAANTNVSK
jgi:CBS domain-containing protein